MDNYRNTEQNVSVNFDLNKTVDKDVQSMLLPLNLMQFIGMSPKYRIKNNIITPNNFIYIIYSIIGTLLLIFSFVFRNYLLIIYNERLGFTKFMISSTFFDSVFYCFGFAMNFVIGIIQAKNSVKFVLTFQRVHRFLKKENGFNRFIIWNWIILIFGLCGYFIVVSFLNIQQGLPWFCLIGDYHLIVFDINVIYATRFITLLESKVDLWNIKVLNSIETEYFSKKMFQAYVDILECYNIHKTCFQQFILYYIIEVFIHGLVYIKILIETLEAGVRNNNSYNAALGSLLILSWLVKNLTLQTIYMQQCETFYLSYRNVQDSCALILKTNCSDNERRLCKNVLRLHRASFSKIRVCGLFYADASLQLTLIVLLANYSIVLLQFEFL